MNDILKALESARCWETYQSHLKMNIPDFKEHFAQVMVDLEKEEKKSIFDSIVKFLSFNKTAL